MGKFQIPENLIEMLRQRRVIPFIGAGFSSALGLPNWDELLKHISNEITGGLPYDEISKFCKDPLQIAEYYFLKCGKSIGPLRHSISNALHTEKNPIISGAHVELVNLGSPQVYTTNFDDLIEKSFKLLNQPYEIISLPKDLAISDGSKTQIVKYHGDLRYEDTLVLTESSYYSRLDFESPMDLKFRSDLLGRSVLFMGYSFRDINIRVIWFKLMEMMRDIPLTDRPYSYIVRFEPNPILETLYDEVGIKTIVLDPNNEAKSQEDRNALFNEFMFELATESSIDANIPGKSKSLFLSSVLLGKIEEQVRLIKDQKVPHPRNALARMRYTIRDELEVPLILAAKRKIPGEFKDRVKEIILELALMPRKPMMRSGDIGLLELTLSVIKNIGPSEGVTLSIAIGLTKHSTREIIFNSKVQWEAVWKSKIRQEGATMLLNIFKNEIEYHDEYIIHGDSEPDYDIAYLADIALRIEQAQIVDDSLSEERKKAKTLLKKASSFYKTINSIELRQDQAPNVGAVIDEINRLGEEKQSLSTGESKVPF